MTRRRVCVAGLLVSVVLMVSGCEMVPSSSPSGSGSSSSAGSTTGAAKQQPTYAELNAEADGYMQELIALAGPGPWKYPSGAVWKVGGLFAPESCGWGNPKEKAYRVTMSVNGPPSTDPEADANRVADGWRAQGYQVSTVVAPAQSPDHDREIRADLPNGAMLGYMASTLITGLDVQSRCSTDPSVERAGR